MNVIKPLIWHTKSLDIIVVRIKIEHDVSSKLFHNIILSNTFFFILSKIKLKIHKTVFKYFLLNV